MLERESYEGKSSKILPLHTRPNFSLMEWKAFLFAYAATVSLGVDVLMMNVSLLVETAAVKAARILKYAVANALIIFAICQAAMACDEARAIVAGFQMSDNHGSAFTLFTLLEDRCLRSFRRCKSFWLN